jgi:hypothetical protein
MLIPPVKHTGNGHAFSRLAGAHWPAMLVLAVIVLIVVPLGRDAWLELKQRRASGEEIPPTIGPRVTHQIEVERHPG